MWQPLVVEEVIFHPAEDAVGAIAKGLLPPFIVATPRYPTERLCALPGIPGRQGSRCSTPTRQG